MKFNQFISCAAVCAAAAMPAVCAADAVVIRDTFAFMDFLEDVGGTAPDAANLPDSRWITLSQNEYTQPSINGSRTSHWAKNAASIDGARSSMIIALGSFNKNRLRISADIAISAESQDAWVGLGFKRDAPGEPGFHPRMPAAASFRGLVVNRSGRVALFSDSHSSEDALSVPALAPKKFYPLSFDVDVSSGDILNIRFDGRHIGDFESNLFDSETTRHAGFFVLDDSRGAVDNFTVKAIMGETKPAVEALGWDYDASGSAVVLKGMLDAGNAADIAACWGDSAQRMTNSVFVARVLDGTFETRLENLAVSRELFFKFCASNSAGKAESAAVKFVSPAQAFKWTGAAAADGRSGLWDNPSNWSANARSAAAFPNGAGQSVFFEVPPNRPNNEAQRVLLNRPRVAVGALSITPAHYSDDGFEIAAGAPGQALVFASKQGSARAALIGGRFSGGRISAPVELESDLEISAPAAQSHFGLVFAGPVGGPGAIIAKSGLFALEPLEDTVYAFSTKGGSSKSSFAKRGPASATLRGGSHTVSLAGDWGGARAVSGGGALILDGAAFTNTTRVGHWTLFGGSGNTLAVRNGATFRNLHHNELAVVNTPGNTLEVSGKGSLLDLRKIYIVANADSNSIVVKDGAEARGAGLRLGWENKSGNRAEVSGKGSRWDAGAGMMLGNGAASERNTLVVSGGARVENTWVWVGGYSHWSAGCGSRNSIVVKDGGQLVCNLDDGMGLGSAIGVSGVEGAHSFANTAHVTGKGSEWDLGGHDLRVGDIFTKGASGASNSVAICSGGRLFGVANLRVGVARDGGASAWNSLVVTNGASATVHNILLGTQDSIKNSIAWDASSSVSADTFTAAPGNILAPLIGADGASALAVAGTAKFSFASMISPSAAPGAKPGRHVILRAGKIEDYGLMLDPAKAAEWELEAGEKEIAVVRK